MRRNRMRKLENPKLTMPEVTQKEKDRRKTTKIKFENEKVIVKGDDISNDVDVLNIGYKEETANNNNSKDSVIEIDVKETLESKKELDEVLRKGISTNAENSGYSEIGNESQNKQEENESKGTQLAKKTVDVLKKVIEYIKNGFLKGFKWVRNVFLPKNEDTLV